MYVSAFKIYNLSAIQCNWQCPRVLKSVLQRRAYRALLWPLRRVAIVGSAYSTTDHGSGASPHHPAPYLPTHLPTYPYLTTYLPTRPTSYLPTCILTYQPIPIVVRITDQMLYLTLLILTYLPTYLLTYSSTWIPTHQPTPYLPTYFPKPPTYLPTYLTIHIAGRITDQVLHLTLLLSMYLPNYPPSHLRFAGIYLQMHINIQSNLQAFHTNIWPSLACSLISDHSRGAQS